MASYEKDIGILLKKKGKNLNISLRKFFAKISNNKYNVKKKKKIQNFT